MRAQRDQQGLTIVSMHFWTYPEAVKAVPYIRAVIRSLRDSWLRLRQARLRLERLASQPGRPDRHGLILREDLAQDVQKAGQNCDDALNELMTIDVYSLDPAAGVALIP